MMRTLRVLAVVEVALCLGIIAGCSDDDGSTSSSSTKYPRRDGSVADASETADAATADAATDASSADASTDEKPKFGAWGFDLTGMNTAAKPGDSFNTYANGTWLTTHEIPSDRTRWGSFDELSSATEMQLRSLVDALPEGAAAGSNAQKVRDYFSAYVDTARIEQRGLEPIQPALAAIDAAKTPEDVARLMSRADLALYAPIGIGVTIDEKNPDRYIVGIGQSGLGLPDRDYYLNEAPVYRELVATYKEHIARLLRLIGISGSESQATAIVDLETQIAQQSWPIAKRRDRDATYNLRTREQLAEGAGDFPWGAALEEAGLGNEKEFVIYELDAVQSLARTFSSVPVATWAAYLKYHYVADHAAVLPRAIDDERFAFYGRTLNGQPEQRERWKRGIANTSGALGEAVGELYVDKYFPQSSKDQMVKLVENLRSTYSARIQALSWMTDDTKAAAQKKLDTFLPKIGYPNKWKDYSALEVKGDDAFGNVVRAGVWSWQDDIAHLGKPTDKTEWSTTPQTVNAFYNPTFNEITFPAAILQPPFFDPAADLAVNYGGIGAVIGHEMGHGFDDQGAKSDERGVLRTWWKPEDEEAFGKLVQGLIDQYDMFEPLPGLHVNGALTVGENIGDLGGMSVAYAAYHAALGGKEAPVRDGLTGDQRFFLSWAQVWRELIRDEALRNLVMSDPHSPARYRIDGVVRNIDAWYQAFDVKEGDALYLPAEERVHIW